MCRKQQDNYQSLKIVIKLSTIYNAGPAPIFTDVRRMNQRNPRALYRIEESIAQGRFPGFVRGLSMTPLYPAPLTRPDRQNWCPFHHWSELPIIILINKYFTDCAHVAQTCQNPFNAVAQCFTGMVNPTGLASHEEWMERRATWTPDQVVTEIEED